MIIIIVTSLVTCAASSHVHLGLTCVCLVFSFQAGTNVVEVLLLHGEVMLFTGFRCTRCHSELIFQSSHSNIVLKYGSEHMSLSLLKNSFLCDFDDIISENNLNMEEKYK